MSDELKKFDDEEEETNNSNNQENLPDSQNEQMGDALESESLEDKDKDKDDPKRYVPWISRTEKGLYAQMLRVLVSLVEDPLNIPWIAFEKIKLSVERYGLFFISSNKTSDALVSVNSVKKELAKEMIKNSKYLKMYIGEAISEKNKYAYYAEFGFEHSKQKYTWENNAAKLRISASKAIQAIDKYNLNDRIYGTEYWTNILSQYAELDDRVSGDRGGNSFTISDKNVERETIEQVLSSIVLITRGSYPKDWEARLRKRGFLKERN